MGFLDVSQAAGDGAFGKGGRDGHHRHFGTTRQSGGDGVQHGPHHSRHPRHYIDIADVKAGRDRSDVLDQRRAMGNARHALAHIVEFAGLVTRFQRGIGLGVVTDADIKSACHGIGGDVVMGGADAARGEDQVIAAAQGIQPRDDFRLDIGHNPDFLEVNAQRAKKSGDMAGIAVLGAAGEDFVPDYQHRGGFVGTIWE